MKLLRIILLLVPLFWYQPAWAEPEIARPVISRIENEGYAVLSIERTWLGRIVITARDEQNLREVVLNRTTGEVLRDSLFSLPDAPNKVDGAASGDASRNGPAPADGDSSDDGVGGDGQSGDGQGGDGQGGDGHGGDGQGGDGQGGDGQGGDGQGGDGQGGDGQGGDGQGGDGNGD